MPDPARPDPSDLTLMAEALAEARKAAAVGEVPVGALVVREGRVIARAHNLRQALADPTAHAERLALALAGGALGTWRLEACTLFVTLEPCPMCAGAIVLARLPRLVFGAHDPKAGACRSLYRLVDDPRFNHRVAVTAGVLAAESAALLSQFFREQRPNHPRRGA